jgi:nucleoside-diphosphate-sugar epimerase
MASHYGPNFSLFEVPDITLPGALDEAVKGCDGIAHMASPVSESYNPDPQAVIPKNIRSALSALESAAKEPSVKSVVYTSSQTAAFTPAPNKEYHVTPDTWNEESKDAWTMPIVPTFRRMLFNYMRGKMEAEQQSWEWVKEHKPHFTFNTILPNVNWGTMVRPDQTGFGSSSGLLKTLWNGNVLPVDLIPPQWFIDVEDTGLLHLAALTQPDVRNERILAMASRYCYNEVLDIFRKIAPDHTFLENVDEVLDRGTVDNKRAEEILKSVKGGKGWSSLEEAIRKWSVFMLDAEKAEKEGRKWPDTVADGMAKAFEGLPKEAWSFYG